MKFFYEIKIFLKKKWNFKIKYWTPLHFAATNNSKEMGELLISHGAEVNAQSFY